MASSGVKSHGSGALVRVATFGCSQGIGVIGQGGDLWPRSRDRSQ